MLFFSFFKTLVDHEVTVELKNDIQIRGTLKSVDQYLNIKLDDIQVVEELKYPHLVSTHRVGGAGESTREPSSMATCTGLSLIMGVCSHRSKMSSLEEAWLDMFICLEVR
ncbi:U6 snRNA-associated Sm-like protein LSm2 [Lachnellula suecica]|uniref:U6 snRNA-associated Sm-like protein LSm2 n=1 Tax=Lachnellula suecica TaxID=602035 RepID=A0A8T9CMN7_9HELO|nr:U6 snRNA-associated Sm-like protein LSm2 [Lachnellula suecica]